MRTSTRIEPPNEMVLVLVRIRIDERLNHQNHPEQRKRRHTRGETEKSRIGIVSS